MMMMNCFCGMTDWQGHLALFPAGTIVRSTPLRISNMLQVGFEPAQNLSSGLVE